MRLAPEAAADYDDAGWKKSAEPQQMGADGDTMLSPGTAVVERESGGAVRPFISAAAPTTSWSS